MRRRLSILVPAAVAGLVAPVTALTGTAHAATGPQVTSVQTHLVQPSTLGSHGGFAVQVDAKVPQGEVCSFSVRLYSDRTGWHDLGTHQGSGPSLRYTDYLPASELAVWREYRVTAYDCNGTPGNEGASRFPLFGLTGDVQYRKDPICSVGPRVTRSSSSAYGGSWARTTGGIGTSVTCTPYDYAINVGVYGTTGRWGGRAAVFLDGVRKGTVDFSSDSTSYRRLMYKAGGTGGTSAPTPSPSP